MSEAEKQQTPVKWTPNSNADKFMREGHTFYITFSDVDYMQLSWPWKWTSDERLERKQSLPRLSEYFDRQSITIDVMLTCKTLANTQLNLVACLISVCAWHNSPYCNSIYSFVSTTHNNTTKKHWNKIEVWVISILIDVFLLPCLSSTSRTLSANEQSLVEEFPRRKIQKAADISCSSTKRYIISLVVVRYKVFETYRLCRREMEGHEEYDAHSETPS